MVRIHRYKWTPFFTGYGVAWDCSAAPHPARAAAASLSWTSPLARTTSAGHNAKVLISSGTPEEPTAPLNGEAGAEAQASHSFQTLEPAFTSRAGEMVGPYKLIAPIGEGGFGEVWLAERREPFTQRVALKLIKPGMDSKAVIARFEQERQALAVMNHPCIAKVFDGGITKEGRPFFAMEYVKGEPITDFCDAQKIGVRERLVLFGQACEAVQHAHLKGIVHRDIKPSNILAFEVEGEGPKLKVIDFGVAKAMSQPLTERTIFTETGQMIGTPAYMSPEQADPTSSDIDTRSDIYSLGVLLYELIAGATPFDAKTLRAKAYGEIQRIIREEDPPSPSARLSTISTRDAELASRIEKARGVGLRDLTNELRSELEWIPLKAMRKEPRNRYQTALSLAEDVRSYLEGKPIAAAPESIGYRLKKYVRRHRAAVVATSLVGIALLTGLGTALYGWRETTIAKNQALEAKQDALEAAARANEERALADLARADAEQQRQALQENRDQMAESARQMYRALSSSLGWLEIDYGREGGDPLVVVGAQRDLEKAQFALISQRGKPSPVAVGLYVRTLLRYGAVCKRTVEIEKGLEAMQEAEELLAAASPTDWTAIEMREMTARVLEVKADLLLKGGRDPEAHPLHERAFAIREEVVRDTASAPDAVYNLSKSRQRIYDAQIYRGEYAAAVATADAMIAERGRILAHELQGNDAARKDRYERDVMLGHHWRALARLELGDIDGAEADAAAMLATARKRAAVEKPARDAEWDLALALQDSARAQSARARFAEAAESLAPAIDAIDTAIARNNASQATLASGYEIAGDRLEALLATGRGTEALAAAAKFEEKLMSIVRGLKTDDLKTLATRAGLPAVRFELLRLSAMLGAGDASALEKVASDMRAALPQSVQPSRNLPLWVLDAATLSLRATQGDKTAAREAAELALASATESGDARQAQFCILELTRLCERADIEISLLDNFAAAKSVASQPELVAPKPK
jgi:serine/threonine protein kinase